MSDGRSNLDARYGAYSPAETTAAAPTDECPGCHHEPHAPRQCREVEGERQDGCLCRVGAAPTGPMEGRALDAWLAAELAAAERERDALRVLLPYADHHMDCCVGMWDRPDLPRKRRKILPCSCGYESARAALAETEG